MSVATTIHGHILDGTSGWVCPHVLPRLESDRKSRKSAIVTQDISVLLGVVHNTIQEAGISLLSVCQASFAALLSIIVGEEDICFGNVMSGRSVTIDRIDGLVAPCFNTVPVRTRLSELSRSIDSAKSFLSLNANIPEHQFTPTRHIQSLLHRINSISARLFDTLLIVQQPSRPLNESIWNIEKDDGFMDVSLRRFFLAVAVY